MFEFISAWARLRNTMRKGPPPGFRREEWAYLIEFLSPENLSLPFQSMEPRYRYRPRGLVGVWLPNNVSLLGPLNLILLSLTGNRLTFKTGSAGGDLTSAFLQFALDAMEAGPLRDWLASHVSVATWGHDDLRNRELAESAQVRIVFGSDAAAEAVHRLGSVSGAECISFVDRHSEAWLSADSDVAELAKVFLIYGAAGCTSPRRVWLIGASRDEAIAFRERLLRVWPSGWEPTAFLSHQLARAYGWDSERALLVGTADLQVPPGNFVLPILYGSAADAVKALPANAQTIGYAGERPDLTGTSVVRVVPLARMHAFGHIWDGINFWLRCLECVEVQ